MKSEIEGYNDHSDSLYDGGGRLRKATSSDPTELLTVDELAFILKVPKSWIYEHTRKNTPDQLPYIKLGKYLRFFESEVRAFLEKKSRPNGY